MPGFEVEAILRVRSDFSHDEIGCVAAQIMDGNTFNHQIAIGTTLARFTLLAVLPSFVITVYYDLTSGILNRYTCISHSRAFRHNLGDSGLQSNHPLFDRRAIVY